MNSITSRYYYYSARIALVACLLVACFARPVEAQEKGEKFDVRASYQKREFRIPMRDGVKLFTSVYLPRDTSRTYPIMFTRTPYTVSPYGEDKYKENLGPSAHFMREGYIFVYQDVRGKFLSEGEYMDVRPYKPRKGGATDIDESTDAYDTIEWLVKNIPHHNGRVGMWGISYPGFYTSMGLLDAHPALRAASPQAPIADWFIGDDWHHNGTLFLAHTVPFFSSFGLPRPQPTTEWPPPGFKYGTPDGYKFFLDMGALPNANEKYYKGQIAFWNELMAHPNYDDYWKARNVPQHLSRIRPAVLTVGGWFDAEDLYGALKTYEAIERKNPGISNSLVMGPWLHGGWAGMDGDTLGDINFGEKTGVFYREKIEFPFFQCVLKDRCDERLPEAYIFETGSNRWRRFDSWPPKSARETSLYLDADGRLSFNAPPPPATTTARAFDEYVSDPWHPVPHLNRIAIGMTGDYMIQDQRFATRRPDVLVYQTEPLARDITLAGPVKANLTVSTTGTDSDFIVKLIDVFPDDTPDPNPNPRLVRMGGYQMLVRGEPMRARFRNSWERPEAMTPNQPTKVEFVMPDTSHTFRKGHRIMVQIQSSWFPLVDRNPQKFVNIYQARDSDFQKATQRIYRAGRTASHLKLSVLP
ncbi:MAG TPA: CocE/NonD family hydrolase [Pyrinomonadaceae bacterium]|nr:CocE/NonD family hydrolase [Pyrinomonadaceae bacterium]